MRDNVTSSLDSIQNKENVLVPNHRYIDLTLAIIIVYYVGTIGHPFERTTMIVNFDDLSKSILFRRSIVA